MSNVDPELPDATAERIDAVVAAIEQPVADLFAYSRRTRHLLFAFAGSLLFDVAMSVVVALFALQVHHLAGHANRIAVEIADLTRARSQAACAARNEFKRLDLERWHAILEISADGAKPKAKEALRATKFRAFIEKADLPEDCAAATVDAR